MFTSSRCLRLFGLLAFLLFPRLASASEEPIALLKRTQEQLKLLLKRTIPKGDKKAQASKEEDLKTLIRPFFNFKRLAQDSLKDHWKTLSEPQRTLFLFWLEALLENAYLQNMNQGSSTIGSDKEPEIDYKKQTLEDSKATVFTVIRIHDSKKDKWKRIRVDWAFQKQDGKWMVIDLLTNDNSLVETYQEQFEKILKKEAFDGLIKKIKTKVNDLRKEDGRSPLQDPSSSPPPSKDRECADGKEYICKKKCLKFDKRKKKCLKKAAKETCACE